MFPCWQYRTYSEDELASLDKWINGSMHKDVILGENLWENMAKVSKKMDLELHPIFSNPDYYIRLAKREVSSRSNAA